MAVCPVCGRDDFENTRKMRAHIREDHGGETVESPAEEGAGFGAGGDFSAPSPKRPGRSTAKRGPGRPRKNPPAVQPVAVDEQIALIYRVLGDLATTRGLPSTGQLIKANSTQIGDAWDQFLRQFPGLYEMIERGLIAGPLVTLLMLHVQIVQSARAEAMARAEFLAQQEQAGGGPIAA